MGCTQIAPSNPYARSLTLRNGALLRNQHHPLLLLHTGLTEVRLHLGGQQRAPQPHPLSRGAPTPGTRL